MLEREVFGEEAMELFGEQLAAALKNGGVVSLEGNLGMGKTTLVRGVLRGLGYQGPVKSPTYTIVEPYELADAEVYHFDLYRISDAEELEYMGIRDYFKDGALCLVEWAEMGEGVLPRPDLVVHLSLVRHGRAIAIEPKTPYGVETLAAISERLAN
ncbi:tRNA (adenosine(37)-N6)-threonylcarbamoyltransferase complex ATPase subunit type 1 TsaE [Marinomonas ostreistagni]|uniref:tRNA (adenosine(37)-N6)-threonylcarbamoyltransferase complex ATPase subunit type 1 TsaE n=1 Tax=Marinomonas ostreistagni TaxID=359209 RepID=UPI001950834B|nr:tRNA (adenosine(37)-N6)-threonylcarbamoyltransferase complex ATPase subunit type 1 TsaE [Marinomonas ostreistagni]MBM6549719.1 tRNA (adenosine(37)-N6)-threonylcarbamoyltransferase complex ATPase subunit type 1 TsaE [Marinomonas ostreistagni]